MQSNMLNNAVFTEKITFFFLAFAMIASFILAPLAVAMTIEFFDDKKILSAAVYLLISIITVLGGPLVLYVLDNDKKNKLTLTGSWVVCAIGYCLYNAGSFLRYTGGWATIIYPIVAIYYCLLVSSLFTVVFLFITLKNKGKVEFNGNSRVL